jgi:hypothetical protein
MQMQGAFVKVLKLWEGRRSMEYSSARATARRPAAQYLTQNRGTGAAKARVGAGILAVARLRINVV